MVIGVAVFVLALDVVTKIVVVGDVGTCVGRLVGCVGLCVGAPHAAGAMAWRRPVVVGLLTHVASNAMGP